MDVIDLVIEIFIFWYHGHYDTADMRNKCGFETGCIRLFNGKDHASFQRRDTSGRGDAFGKAMYIMR